MSQENPETVPARSSLLRNWMSLAGLVIVVGGVFSFLLLFVLDSVAHFANPYISILTWMIAPAFLVIGENSRENDLNVNVTKEKKLTNIRAAGSDDALQLIPPKLLSLEQAIEFIKEDELVEVTPTSVRIRKKILESNKRPKFV